MFKYIKTDFPSSIVLSFVTLPLYLGIELVIGVPLFSGLIAGFVVGILVVVLSGSILGDSGPAFDNMVSGIIGGLPIKQVIMRCATYVLSGVKSIVSTFFHGFLIIFSVILSPKLLNMITLSILATVYFMLCFKLAKPSIFNKMFILRWKQFIPIMSEFEIMKTNHETKTLILL